MWGMGLKCSLVLLAAVLAAGCSAIKVNHLPGAEGLPLVGGDGVVPELEYLIRPGDDLEIKFFYTQELNEAIKVRPDGYITLQLIDELKVAGMTPKQLDAVLTDKYSKHLKDPSIAVIARSFKGFRAYVGGEVSVPQVVSLDGGMSVIQAIYRAGGTLPTANMESVILIRKGPNGEPIPYHLDLSDGAVEQSKVDLQVALSPSDVIYVPRSPIANANRWVQQYITDLVLFKGVQLGFGVSYVIEHDKDDND
ncbi:sugar transporter [Pseudomonas sp. HMWF032]|nr:sugar transporter [Pseudomonas sp. HMWF032]PTT80704.1 sugar transporter [Pseudomonas sp. HMWF010]